MKLLLLTFLLIVSTLRVCAQATDSTPKYRERLHSVVKRDGGASTNVLLQTGTKTVVSGTNTARHGQPLQAYDGLIATADAVLAVEILSTDYTATPADGPMAAAAKVWKSVKGPFIKGKVFRFTETAWVGPTYQKGEHRILFLEKAASTKAPRTNQWRILSHLYAKGDFFIEKAAVPNLSLESLESFLKTIQDSGNRPKKVVFDKGTAK